MEIKRENVEEIKKDIKECLRDNTKTIKFDCGGRGSGKTYELITALDECLCELDKTNKELISNQKSILETNGILLRRLLKLNGITDVEDIINGKSNS